MTESIAEFIRTKKRYEKTLLKKANVIGVGVGFRDVKGEVTNDLAVVTLVERKQPLEELSPEDLVPRHLDGAQTDVFEIGKIRAQLTTRNRFRPKIPAGVSIGHTLITAGTLGAFVRDRDTGDVLLLSNNHVLANSNDSQPGDFILQPGPIDSGSNPDDRVARLERYIKIFFAGDTPPTTPPPHVIPPPTPSPDPVDPVEDPGSGLPLPFDPVDKDEDDQPIPSDPNDPTPKPKPDTQPDKPTIDQLQGCLQFASWFGNLVSRLNTRKEAVPIQSQNAGMPTPIYASAQAFDSAYENQLDAAVARPINPDLFELEIMNIGPVLSSSTPTLGMQIEKTGRTTGYTEGIVRLLNVTVNVTYSTSEGDKVARFTNQVIASPMSQPGDSGSLIVEKESDAAVGLLFAGSDLSTIFTPIDIVLDSLNLTF